MCWWFNTSDGILYLIHGDYSKPYCINIRKWERLVSHGNNNSEELPIKMGEIDKVIASAHAGCIYKLIVIPKQSNNVSSSLSSLPNDCLLTSGSDEYIKLWDLTTCQELGSVRFTPVTTAFADSTIIYYMCRISDSFMRKESIGNSNTRIAAGSYLSSPLFACTRDIHFSICNFVTQENLYTVASAHDEYVSCILYSESLDIIVTSSNDKTVKGWKPMCHNFETKRIDCEHLFTIKLEKACKKMVFLDRSDYCMGSSSSVGSEGRYIVVAQYSSLVVVDLKLQKIVQQIDNAHESTIWYFGLL